MKLTLIVTISAVLLILGFDAVQLVRGGDAWTISYLVWTSSQKYPLIPFLLGMLAGHLTWQFNPNDVKPS